MKFRPPVPHESKDEKGKKACAAVQDGQGASTEGGRKLRAGELVSLTPRDVACVLGTVAGGDASDGNPRCVERARRSVSGNSLGLCAVDETVAGCA